jgi:hypothetical protein
MNTRLHCREIAADRDWWSVDARSHYRELAHWLRGIAAKCQLPYTQKELIDLARRYEVGLRELLRFGDCAERVGKGDADFKSWARRLVASVKRK